jgi:hypothetical protein
MRVSCNLIFDSTFDILRLKRQRIIVKVVEVFLSFFFEYEAQMIASVNP